MNIYGTFQTDCNANECCDYCDWRIRFWCKVKFYIEDIQEKIIKRMKCRK